MTKIIYYTTASAESPAKKFIESLTKKQQRKVSRVISYIEEYGLTTAIPHLKKLTGTPLWEMRILGKDNIRVFYAILVFNSILLLHGFIKKSQQTPQKEIKKAVDRLADWVSTQEI